MIETLFPLGVQHYLMGGALVGLGIGLPFIFTGLVAGISTMFTSTWSYFLKGSFFQSQHYLQVRSWRLALAFGVVTGGLVYVLFFNGGETVTTSLHPLRLFVGGILIGIGSRMSGGCTSGHGICGIAAWEKVSLAATITFLSVAILVAYLTNLIF